MTKFHSTVKSTLSTLVDDQSHIVFSRHAPVFFPPLALVPLILYYFKNIVHSHLCGLSRLKICRKFWSALDSNTATMHFRQRLRFEVESWEFGNFVSVLSLRKFLLMNRSTARLITARYYLRTKLQNLLDAAPYIVFYLLLREFLLRLIRY